MAYRQANGQPTYAHNEQNGRQDPLDEYMDYMQSSDGQQGTCMRLTRLMRATLIGTRRVVARLTLQRVSAALPRRQSELRLLPAASAPAVSRSLWTDAATANALLYPAHVVLVRGLLR